MFPLSLLNAATDNQILIELKNGFCYNGLLVNCDKFMNVNLKDVTLTSKNGQEFWKLNSCYIRGATIKYFQVEPELADRVKDDDGFSGGGGGRGGRGGGRGGAARA
ncbi:hypothetical protein FNF29_02379 [Cafeteria roenbergensis]|uniref:U6 snRNA-associated Sm-like protein LSm4 n=1 Tax=Cafeteria roenbergensis TaxID=33653 RepID=A0A5A8CNB6_CAFRO|nr:hypothetical protein FNF29_02379 [Cafeteria roenbergensis]|eukprot:KAA0154502.1 hypothetical protein FNF29_02379 [Cafeteria roenbergensis]